MEVCRRRLAKMKKPKKLQMDKICRVCLRETGHLRSIVETKVPQMMEYCASVKVTDDDNLPKQICVTCFHHVCKFYKFKRKMEINDKYLHNYIERCKEPEKNVPCERVNIADIKNEVEIKEEIVGNTDLMLDGPPPLLPFEIVTIKTEPMISPVNPPPLVPIKSPLDPLEIEQKQPSTSKLECSLCGDEFNTIDDLGDHRKLKHQSHRLQCNICQKEFLDRKKLIGHLNGHKLVKQYACKICGKRYPSPSTFKVHMRMHTGERPFKCEVCDKGFVRWADVVGHMRRHNAQKSHECEMCGRCFKTTSNLERHKILHTSSFPFRCKLCDKSFRQANNLQRHVKMYHTFEMAFPCKECGKGFVSSAELKRHMSVHSGVKPYRCEQCDKAYSYSKDLRNHESRVHSGSASEADKRHVCSICGMRFYHACRLSKHEKTHEKKTCQICKKAFSTALLLSTHIEFDHQDVSSLKILCSC